MQYLSLENVSKSYGEKVLFEGIDLSITKGDKIALVAKNGSGKTTLLKMIAGEEAGEGEKSKIAYARDIKIGYLRQSPYFNPEFSVLDTVLDSDHPSIVALKKYEQALLDEDADGIEKGLAAMEELKAWNIESQLKEILGKLNIKQLDQTMSTLSGGQQKRVALAKILFEEPDFLILDEPTNHLDLDMIEWLEQFLQRSSLTLFMVTHDRYFLERVCTVIIELDGGNLYTYRGNYTDFLVKKDMRIQNEQTVLDKTKKLYKKELEWIRRQPKARGTKAKSRIGEFYDIKDRAHKTTDDDEMKIFIQSSRLGSKIVELHNVSKAYGDLKLINGFDYKFKKNEKVGIVGPNGAGKSTLLDLLTGKLKTDTGKLVVGDTVVFGHYTQDGIKLNEDRRVIDVIRDIAEYIPLEKGQKITAAALLERFLFLRSQQQVYVSQLSGGEKRRLYLLTVLMKNPNFLILDEPTNDLDVLTLKVLEDYLETFRGVLVIVSHDRYFMDKLVDHLFVLEGNGEIRDYLGNYTKYRNNRKSIASDSPVQKKETTVEETTPPADKVKEKVSYKEKMEFQEIEKNMSKWNAKKEKINEQFLSGILDNQAIQELSIELGNLEKEIEQAEERWLELAEKIL